MARAKKLNLPLVSIVTPSYNQAQFIRQTLESILRQGYPCIECIVVDGGSTDGTLKILKSYGKRVRWVSGKDSGQSNAINKGFRMAKGEIIGWLNSDDTYEPGAVKAAVDYLQAHPEVGMVYSDCNIILEDGRRNGLIRAPEFDMEKQLNYANIPPQPTVFFRKEVFRKVGYLDESLHYVMDYDYWIRIGRKFKIKKIPGVLANFRVWGTSKTVGSQHRFWDELRSVSLKHGGKKWNRMYLFHFFRPINHYLFNSPLYGMIRQAYYYMRL